MLLCRFRLLVVDRLYGTVAFDDFSTGEEEPQQVHPVLKVWMRLLAATLPGDGDDAGHGAAAAAADASLHAIIISPVSAHRPQGLAPPPLSSPIIIVVSSSEQVSATAISAAGAPPATHPHTGTRHRCWQNHLTTTSRSSNVMHLPPLSGAWHALPDGAASSIGASPATITVTWPQSVVQALLASDAAGQAQTTRRRCAL
jgi:hypothetical protein